MVKIQVVGPTLLSGIGQLCKKYVELFPNTEYKTIYRDTIEPCETMFIFALPVKHWLDIIPHLKQQCDRLICMSICETETVHPDYGLLFDHFDTIVVASEFCKRVFSRQFPKKSFHVIHANVPIRVLPPVVKSSTDRPYVFYHIGNIIDDRKNFRRILEAFIRLNQPDTHLLVKATCNQNVSINIPRVTIINGLLPDEEIDKIHADGDCYVSFSKSEGIGMGAVEAALHDKPVIISEYGGAVEYIKTPYTIRCGLQTLTQDDFLFQKGMQWGDPNFDDLVEFMGDAYKKQLRHMEHTHTKELLKTDAILEEFRKAVSLVEPHERYRT